jgi:hypothetical protein
MPAKDKWRPQIVAHLAVFSMLTALMAPSPAAADDRVVCQQAASVTSRFVRNASHFPVRLSVIVPGRPGYTITSTSSLPSGTKCPTSGAVTFLAEASTDAGRTYHRVMSRTRAQTGDTWLVEVAPDSFNGNFDYSAQFSVQTKPSF